MIYIIYVIIDIWSKYSDATDREENMLFKVLTLPIKILFITADTVIPHNAPKLDFVKQIQQHAHARTLAIKSLGTESERAWCGNCSIVVSLPSTQYKECRHCLIEWKFWATVDIESDVQTIKSVTYAHLHHLKFLGHTTGRAASRDGVGLAYFIGDHWKQYAA